MYSSRKNLGNQEVYSNYSIYSSFCTFTIRYQNCQPHQNLSRIYETRLVGVSKRISFVLNCFSLYTDYLLNRISIIKLIANRFHYNSWNLHYFIIERRLHFIPSYDREIDEGHKAFEIVQLLKNDIMDDAAESDDNNQLENLAHRKTKKSLFATLIKRKNPKRSKVKITKKIETCSTINFETESVPSEQELTHYHFSESEQCYPQMQARKTKHYNFFKKIMKRPKLNNELPDKMTVVADAANASGETNSAETNIANEVLTPTDFMPTAYIPKYNVKLINGINELQDILQNLHHCEEHMLYLLKKFVEDKSFQKQLFDASLEYFALQYDSKCQVNTLADKLWYQQLEIAKIQDYNVQKRMNFLVKTNRALHLQVENLGRYCEKLISRTNLYPKRFFHMRSFGKTYARNLIESNRRLHNKIKALTEVISDFEDELQKLQHQKGVLEDEKRALKSQLYNLECVLEKEDADHDMSKTQMILQINQMNVLINASVDAARHIFQDLHDFEHKIKDQAVDFTWPTFQYQDGSLMEMLCQIRGCVGELFAAMLSAYKQATTIAKDVTQLRNTNARLQENLQKSTNELNNLGRKLQKSTAEVDVNTFEPQNDKLVQENLALKLKLENANEQNKFLREQIDDKDKTLTESKISVNDVWTQHQILLNQIDDIVQITLQMAPNDLPKHFNSNQEKLDYVKLRSSQMLADRRHWIERCNALEDENQNLIQTQQAYQQDLATLQDGLTILSADSETVKRQLIMEHQTVTSLQNERIKYLEEKNLLKTIFHHFKSEISRVQHLEGAVADMSKETSRLSLIAEFNKQIGEQLKNEVELKENTIIELRQSLEKLSHLQIDSDKEKLTLCAQLSEVATVKEKLSDCLEMELKKNFHLDESKKKLESNTKSQLKIYEEMQKNERAALKELLKDFRCLIKQRDCLVHMQEESRDKYKELEKHYHELKKQQDGAVKQVSSKNDEAKRILEKLNEQEEQVRQLEENNRLSNIKYEKNLRKLEKLLAQMRSEKSEMQTSNICLNNNLQKMESELEDWKEKEAGLSNQLKLKIVECASLQADLHKCKNDLQTLIQENAKYKLEMEYMKKIYEHKTSELKETVSMYSSKENMYAETQHTVLSKEQQINDLNKVIFEKEADVRHQEQECCFLKKQNDDLNKILIGYENQLVILQDVEAAKLKIEEEMNRVMMEHKNTITNFECARREIDKLKHELKEQAAKSKREKSFYKDQTNEIILEYSEQKVNIEEEIDSISDQLRVVTENLHKEKLRFEELTTSHNVLEAKYRDLQQSYDAELNANKDTSQKISDMEKCMQLMAAERDNLKQQVHVLLMELTDEKESNTIICNENKTMQMILEQGRQQYGALMGRNCALETELREVQVHAKSLADSKNAFQEEVETTQRKLEEKTAELKSSKETIECLRKELNDAQKTLFELKEDYFKLQQQVTGLEFKNCELTLQLHQTQGKLETERNLYQDLKQNKHPESPMGPSDNGESY